MDATAEIRFPNGSSVGLLKGDITTVAADAIANAANAELAAGGGVDGAIHRAAGPSVMRELNQIRPRIGGGCPTGSAVATGAGDLPARYIFHAVGPVYRGGGEGEAGLLASCYDKCLDLAAERGVRTITFPAISAGVYGYPLDEAARIALETVARRLSAGHPSVRRAVFVLFGKDAYDAFKRALGGIETAG